MTITTATPAVSTPHCPTCGQAPVSERTIAQRGVITGHYADEAGHIWKTEWLAGGC